MRGKNFNLNERGPSQGFLAPYSPFGQLVISFGLMLTVYVVVSTVIGLFLKSQYGISGSDMLQQMDSFLAQHGDNLQLYRLLQMVSTFAIFGLSGFLASYLITGKAMGMLEFNRKANFSSMTFIPVIIILVFPVIALVYSYLSQLPVPDSLVEMEASLEQFTMAMLQDERWSVFIINFLMIAVLPALFEEVMFRGVIQRLFIKTTRNPHLGILFTGLIFGLIHGQVFKFLPIAVLGILLGYLYYWTKNLWFPILAHFFHNGIQVVLYFLVAKGWVDMDVESQQMLPPLQTAMFAVLFVGAMYLFYNANRNTAHEPI